jgi:hypothetical protein
MPKVVIIEYYWIFLVLMLSEIARLKSALADRDQEMDKLVKDCKAKESKILAENAQFKSERDQALNG